MTYISWSCDFVKFFFFLGKFLSKFVLQQSYLAHAYILAWPLECNHPYLTLTYISRSIHMLIVLVVYVTIMNHGQNVCLDHF